MDKTPATSRDRDPIEAVLYFLFRNWILLVCLPIAASAIALAFALGTPQTFTASILIPAPPVPLIAFDDLWRDPKNPHGAMVSANGNVRISRAAATEAEARASVEATQAMIRGMAKDAIAVATERQAVLSSLEARLVHEVPTARSETIVAQATALAALVEAAETAAEGTNSLREWARKLDEREITVSSSGRRLVLLAAFGAFTLALAIAIARWLLRRAPNGQQSR
jgi:hypothetical protein